MPSPDDETPEAQIPAAETSVPAPAERLITDLRDQGFGVLDDFVPHKTVVRLRTCADLRSIRGEFKPAAIGSARTRQRREDIRGDFTCWPQEPLYPAERETLALLEQLRLELNRNLLLGLLDVEIHYASFPPGAAYARHVDQPEGTHQRRLSFALYLNLEWDAQAGGELRLYEAERAIADIEPRGGRLACFLTEGRVHEVLPAKRVRMALTGWFRVRAVSGD
jgi:SM-20-related protein